MRASNNIRRRGAAIVTSVILIAASDVAAQETSPAVSMGNQDCATQQGQAAVLAVYTVLRPTDLTAGGLRTIIADPRLTFVHWRWEGVGDNVSGDRYFCDVLQDFGQHFDRIIRVEGSDYRFRLRRIKAVLDEVNPRMAYTTHNLPNYSIVGNGVEARIERAPDDDRYMDDYFAWLEPIGSYIEALARGEMPNQVRRSR